MKRTLESLANRVFEAIGVEFTEMNLVGQTATLEVPSLPREELIERVENSVYRGFVQTVFPTINLYFEGVRVRGQPLTLNVVLKFVYREEELDRVYLGVTAFHYTTPGGTRLTFSTLQSYLAAKSEIERRTNVSTA